MDIDDAPDVDDELEATEVSGDQIFRPFPDPADSDFDILMQRDAYHIVRGRQIHARKHKLCCFKYGSWKYRFRFPQKIVLETKFDKVIGIAHNKRTHRRVNNNNNWFCVMASGNQDI